MDATRLIAGLLGMVILASTTAAGAGRHDAAVFARVFPAAESFGGLSGEPPAAPAYRSGSVVGYVFFTREVVGSVGFSGKPLDVAVGLDLAGRITGAEIVEHHEPILAIGVTDAALAAFIRQYRGIDIRVPPRIDGGGRGPDRLDAVSGASVSSLVINDSVIRAARAVARAREIFGGAAVALDLDTFTEADWQALLADGSLARLHLTNAAVDDALRRMGGAGYGPPGVERRPQETFVDLYVALTTPAAIGRNLLPARRFDRLSAALRPGDQAVLVAARGLYSFKGTAWRRSGVFERVQIVQEDRTVRLSRPQYRRIDRIRAAGAPDLREAAIFVVPAGSGLDPTMPWRLELLVAGDGPGGPVHARFAVPYRVPPRLVRRDSAADAEASPLWIEAWRAQWGHIAILVAMLLVLSLILVFQDLIVRHHLIYRRLRLAFLVVTLVWLGWYAGAQLSVVNVITFAQALLSDFRWEVFLVAPLIFILWSYVAVTLLFWGRGVLCGWLCPFGALLELVAAGAQRLGVPQLRVPFVVHERLWPIKYIVFLSLFALSLGGLDRIQWAIEVEPFKTAISLRFAREWPFLVYVAVLLAAGLFVERAFCRYLCPLGAALAIPARLRMFEWLKRKRECGGPCHICADRCPVQAIHPEGHINPNECVYCLNCQVWYYDDHICPPLVDRRKRREARQAAHEKARLAAQEKS